MPTKTLRYGTAHERRARILELLHERSHLSATELSKSFGVSTMTIRRDFQRLASEGGVREVRGGISVMPSGHGRGMDGTGTDFSIRMGEMVEAKRAIARKAVELIREDTTIALDAGTTTLEMVRLLPSKMRLTVVSASLPVTVALADRPEIEVMGLGGVLHRESQAYAGPQTLAVLRELRIHQAFLAASAIRDGQVLCGNVWDSETKRLLVECSDERILLADSSKFHLSAMTRVGPISAMQTLVVDEGITAQDRDGVEAAGTKVLLAPLSHGEEM